MMFLWLPWGLTTTQNSISLKAQDRIWIGSRLTDTRSAENDWIGADTDPAYRIDASLLVRLLLYDLSFPPALLQHHLYTHRCTRSKTVHLLVKICENVLACACSLQGSAKQNVLIKFSVKTVSDEYKQLGRV